MTSQVQSLIKQCSGSNESSFEPSFDKEKFARLLIEECASICELNAQSYKFSFTPARAQLAESTSVHCADRIRKHFGL